jgi:soluble lytic murein transglycosylase-like protein
MRALAVLLLAAASIAASAAGTIPPAATQYRATLVREAQFIYGPGAPVSMFAAQIHQESAWRAGVTAWDNGRGLAQFMDATTETVVRNYPELGPANPYDPRWAIRAMVRYDGWLFARVQGVDPCNRWAAALKSYNAGLGYVQRAQRVAKPPGLWWNAAEWIKTGQSEQNFEYSRTYPRKILFKHQPIYAAWGPLTCQEMIQ